MTGQALPVVDSNNVLVGLVTIDDMLMSRKKKRPRTSKLGGMEALDEPYESRSGMVEARDLANHSLSRRNADATAMRVTRGDRKGGVLAISAAGNSSGGNSGSQATTLSFARWLWANWVAGLVSGWFGNYRGFSLGLFRAIGSGYGLAIFAHL
jgi:hypothetical protein